MSGNGNPMRMGGLGGADIVGDIRNWFNSCPPFTKYASLKPKSYEN